MNHVVGINLEERNKYRRKNMTLDEKAERYADETKLEEQTYKGDVVTAYVCGAIENSKNYDVDVKLIGGKWCPYFKHGNQTFTLYPCEDKKSAIWMANELRSFLKD